LNLEDAKGDPEFGLNHAARRRGGCVAARGARPLVVRWVGALGCPSSSRRRNIEQSPQYGPHLLTVRQPRRRDHARPGDAATRNARRGWQNRVPAETGFCLGRCYAALSLRARPNMAAVKSPVSARKRTCGGGHSVVDGKEICC
jgi:dienelactone hydrolase